MASTTRTADNGDETTAKTTDATTTATRRESSKAMEQAIEQRTTHGKMRINDIVNIIKDLTTTQRWRWAMAASVKFLICET